MTGPTFASVTDQPCECDYLQRSADNPDLPIVFDRLTGEYQLKYRERLGDHDGTAMLVIYHCPFCGGAAPKSKRALLFATIAQEEHERLSKLTKGIKSLDDAVRKLGPPDDDIPSCVTRRTPEKSGHPPTIQSYRSIVYSQLSDTAELHITDFREEGIAFSLQGKYIGPTATGSGS